PAEHVLEREAGDAPLDHVGQFGGGAGGVGEQPGLVLGEDAAGGPEAGDDVGGGKRGRGHGVPSRGAGGRYSVRWEESARGRGSIGLTSRVLGVRNDSAADAARYGRPMLARAWGIARSLVIYHGQPAKHRRAVRLYGEFLGPGDL